MGVGGGDMGGGVVGVGVRRGMWRRRLMWVCILENLMYEFP